MPRHQRLGDLIGTGLMAGQEERITVNRSGGGVQLVRMAPDFRALVEPVPPDDAADLQGWIRTAERAWNLRGYDWRFESLAETWRRHSGT